MSMRGIMGDDAVDPTDNYSGSCGKIEGEKEKMKPKRTISKKSGGQ